MGQGAAPFFGGGDGRGRGGGGGTRVGARTFRARGGIPGKDRRPANCRDGFGTGWLQGKNLHVVRDGVGFGSFRGNHGARTTRRVGAAGNSRIRFVVCPFPSQAKRRALQFQGGTGQQKGCVVGIFTIGGGDPSKRALRPRAGPGWGTGPQNWRARAFWANRRFAWTGGPGGQSGQTGEPKMRPMQRFPGAPRFPIRRQRGRTRFPTGAPEHEGRVATHLFPYSGPMVTFLGEGAWASHGPYFGSRTDVGKTVVGCTGFFGNSSEIVGGGGAVKSRGKGFRPLGRANPREPAGGPGGKSAIWARPRPRGEEGGSLGSPIWPAVSEGKTRGPKRSVPGTGAEKNRRGAGNSGGAFALPRRKQSGGGIGRGRPETGPGDQHLRVSSAGAAPGPTTPGAQRPEASWPPESVGAFETKNRPAGPGPFAGIGWWGKLGAVVSRGPFLRAKLGARAAAGGGAPFPPLEANFSQIFCRAALHFRFEPGTFFAGTPPSVAAKSRCAGAGQAGGGSRGGGDGIGPPPEEGGFGHRNRTPKQTTKGKGVPGGPSVVLGGGVPPPPAINQAGGTRGGGGDQPAGKKQGFAGLGRETHTIHPRQMDSPAAGPFQPEDLRHVGTTPPPPRPQKGGPVQKCPHSKVKTRGAAGPGQKAPGHLLNDRGDISEKRSLPQPPLSGKGHPHSVDGPQATGGSRGAKRAKKKRGHTPGPQGPGFGQNKTVAGAGPGPGPLGKLEIRHEPPVGPEIGKPKQVGGPGSAIPHCFLQVHRTQRFPNQPFKKGPGCG